MSLNSYNEICYLPKLNCAPIQPEPFLKHTCQAAVMEACHICLTKGGFVKSNGCNALDSLRTPR